MASAEELARRIEPVPGLLVEHVVSSGGDGGAVLVDQWGRTHALRAVTVIGRDPEAATIAVLEKSVSRQHAELRRDAGGWRIRDLGSTNGTFVEGGRLTGEAAVGDGQLVIIGDVGFVLVTDGRTLARRKVALSMPPTVESRSVPRAETLLRLLSPAAGEGGVVEFRGASAQLGFTQFALVALLVERFRGDHAADPEVRGFVRAIELLTDLPWDTPHPNDNNVKQLVRRVRRSLERLGLDEAVESRHGFGYRLVVPPGA